LCSVPCGFFAVVKIVLYELQASGVHHPRRRTQEFLPQLDEFYFRLPLIKCDSLSPLNLDTVCLSSKAVVKGGWSPHDREIPLRIEVPRNRSRKYKSWECDQ
jgi:hypothetical protein